MTDDSTYGPYQEQNEAVAQLQDDLAMLALVTAVRALLAAVDYRCNGTDRDVRIRDLWGAAYALKQIERALQENEAGMIGPVERENECVK